MTPINLMSIGVASDHAGYELKTKVIKHLESKGCVVHDFGNTICFKLPYFTVLHKVRNIRGSYILPHIFSRIISCLFYR